MLLEKVYKYSEKTVKRSKLPTMANNQKTYMNQLTVKRCSVKSEFSN